VSLREELTKQLLLKDRKKTKKLASMLNHLARLKYQQQDWMLKE
jgi:hypothetical protein